MSINSIDIHLNAFANFSPVFAEVTKLKAAMAEMQSSSFGASLSSDYVKNIQLAQQEFTNLIQSTNAFKIQSVAMTDSVTQFGNQLQQGNLKLGQYFSLWRQGAKGVASQLDDLATQQARFARSVVVPDALHAGYAQVITDLNGTVTATEKAAFYQAAYNTTLRDGANKLIDFGKNMQWAGRQMTVGLTVPLGLFANQAAQTYLSFDQQMTDMLKVYGAHAVVQSQATLNAIRDQVTSLASDLAHTIGVTMTDTVTIAKTFSAIGLEGQDLINTTKATATLMKLGGLSATDSANAMVSLQNVFKIQSDQMQNAVNFLNAAKHSTSTTMEDMIQAIPRVGPILQQMGGTYKDFVTLLVALKENGVPAAQGANAIKSMFASLDNPTSKAVSLFNNLGISLKGIVSQDANNPLKMILDLQSALDKLPSLTRQQAIEQLFGKFQFARVEALLNSLGKTGSQNAKVLELYNQSNDQLAAVAKQEIDVSSSGTPAAQYAKMKASLQADLIPLGKDFLEVMTKLGNIVDGIVKGFNHLGSAGKILIGGLAVIGLIGPLVMLTGLLGNLVGNIFKGVNYLRMFKEGWQGAADVPLVQRFGAAIHNMSNFYKEVDVNALAAAHSTDLMTLAAENSVKAFDVLATAIRNLTTQISMFNAAANNPLAMGGNLSATLATAGQTARAATAAEQLLLPFEFASGGVVPGSGNSDSVHAMLTPGEFIMNKNATLRNKPFLEAMNAGTQYFHDGGTVKGHIVNPLDTQSAIAQLRAQNEERFGYLASLPEGYVKTVSNLVNTSMSPQLNARLRSGIATPAEFAEGFSVPGQSGLLASAKLGGLDISKMDQKTYDALMKFENALRNRVASLNKEQISDEDLAKETKYLLEKTKNATGAMGKVVEALTNASRQVGQVRLEPGTEAVKSGIISGEYERRGSQVFIKGTNNKVAQWRAGRPVQDLKLSTLNPSYTDFSSAEVAALDAQAKVNIAKRAQDTVNELEKETAKAQESASPAKKAMPLGESWQQGYLEGMQNYGTENAPKTANTLLQNMSTAIDDQMPWWMQKTQTQAEQLMLPFVDEATTAGKQAGTELLSGIETVTQDEGMINSLRNKMSTFVGKVTNVGEMGVGGKMGLGMGLMMAGQTISGLVGGQAGSYISNATNYASMGMGLSMVGPLEAFTGPLMAAGAAVGVFTTAIQQYNKDWQQAQAANTQMMSISSTAAQQFSLHFQTLASYDFSGTTSNLDAHKKSIQENKAAVDALTQAYLNSASGMGGQFIKNLSTESYKSVIGDITKSYLADLATGQFTQQQALQDASAKLTAASMMPGSKLDPLKIQQILKILTNIKTTESSDAATTNFSKLSKEWEQSNIYEQSNNFDPFNWFGPPQSTSSIEDQMVEQLKTLAQTNPGALLSLLHSSDPNVQNAMVAAQGKASSYLKDLLPKNVMDLLNKTNAPASAQFLVESISTALPNMDPMDIYKVLFRGVGRQTSDLVDKAQKAINAKNQAANSSSNNGGNTGGNTGGNLGGTTKDPYTPYIDAINKIKKITDDQTNAQKKYNDELKKTQDFQTKQMDYFNQMKNALTSGNYLQAAQLQQSALNNKQQFAGQAALDASANQTQTLNDKLALLQAADASGQSLKSFLAANKGFQTKYTAADIQKIFGIDTSSLTSNIDYYTKAAASVTADQNKILQGGAFGNLTINVNADGSVTPDNYANQVADLVVARINKEFQKGATSNKTTKPGSSHAKAPAKSPAKKAPSHKVK